MLTAREELAITRCMMYGCTFHYDDYGHPERRNARMYYTCIGEYPFCYRGRTGCTTGYGHSEAQAALSWLRRTGNEGDLNVKQRA